RCNVVLLTEPPADLNDRSGQICRGIPLAKVDISCDHWTPEQPQDLSNLSRGHQPANLLVTPSRVRRVDTPQQSGTTKHHANRRLSILHLSCRDLITDDSSGVASIHPHTRPPQRICDV